MTNQDLEWWDHKALPVIRKFKNLGKILLLIGGILSLSLFLFGQKELGFISLSLFGGMGIYYVLLLPVLLEEKFYRGSKFVRLFVECHFSFFCKAQENKK